MDALRLLAEPRKRQLLELLAGGELSVGEIVSRLDLAQPTVSQHLKILREVGLVEERRDGNFRFYRARPEGLAEARRAIEEFWTRTLDVLGGR